MFYNSFTYEVVLESKDGYEKTKIVSANNCINALHTAQELCGDGWGVKDYRLIYCC